MGCKTNKNCGCKEDLSVLNIRYDGNDLGCISIKPGDNLSTIFKNINDRLCTITDNLQGLSLIENVGSGAGLYKGVDTDSVQQFKSLIEGTGISINETTNEVQISSVYQTTALDFDSNTKELTATYVDGSQKSVVITSTETLTSLSYDGPTKTLSYTDEDQSTTNIDLSGAFSETLTSISLVSGDISYLDEDGSQTIIPLPQNTSDLNNDGDDGVNAFLSAGDNISLLNNNVPYLTSADLPNITFDSVPIDGSTNGVESNGVYDALQLYLPLTGGNVSGDIDMGNNDFTNIGSSFIDSNVTIGNWLYIGEQEGVSGRRWAVEKSNITGKLDFNYQNSSQTTSQGGTYSVFYTLDESGTPTDSTDLITKAYGDANYLTSSSISVEDEGTPVATLSTLNFIGAGVEAVDAGGGQIDVTITGGVIFPVDDTESLVQDPLDNSKQIRLDAENVTTSTVAVLSVNGDNSFEGSITADSIVKSGASSDDILLGDGSTTSLAALNAAVPVDDTTSLVQDPVDNTKQVRIDAGSVATSTVRTITMPDQDVDLSTLIWDASGFSGNLASTDDTLQEVFDKLDALVGGGGGVSELSDLSDVNTSTPTNRNVLVADGTDWESRALVESDISDLKSYARTDIAETFDTRIVVGADASTADVFRLVGTGSGNSNTVFQSFYESNGTTRQGYLGFPSSSNSDLTLRNDVSGQNLVLTGAGSVNFYDGATTRTMWHSGNDGSGSGLDADLLDGVQGSNYARTDISETFDNDIRVRGDQFYVGNSDLRTLIRDNNSGATILSQNTSGGLGIVLRPDGDGSTTNELILSSSNITVGGNKVWHAGNDGSSSGLDADLLDGLQSTQFLRSDIADTLEGDISLTTGRILFGGTSGSNISQSSGDGEINTVFGGAFRFISNGTQLFQFNANGFQALNGGNLITTNEAYGSGWNGNNEVPTKNAVYDKIESLVLGGGSLTTEEVQDIAGAMFSGNTETDISATYQDGDGTIDLAVVSSTTGTANSIVKRTSGGDIQVADESYSGSWNGSLEVPTKNAIYDKIESLGGGLTETSGSNVISTSITNVPTGGTASKGLLLSSTNTTVYWTKIGNRVTIDGQYTVNTGLFSFVENDVVQFNVSLSGLPTPGAPARTTTPVYVDCSITSSDAWILSTRGKINGSGITINTFIRGEQAGNIGASSLTFYFSSTYTV